MLTNHITQFTLRNQLFQNTLNLTTRGAHFNELSIFFLNPKNLQKMNYFIVNHIIEKMEELFGVTPIETKKYDGSNFPPLVNEILRKYKNKAFFGGGSLLHDAFFKDVLIFLNKTQIAYFLIKIILEKDIIISFQFYQK
jgi:hypothetical protein